MCMTMQVEDGRFEVGEERGRKMRRLVGLLVVSSCVWCVPAQALEGLVPHSRHGFVRRTIRAVHAPTVTSNAPTLQELAWARSIAVAYWNVSQPPCGREMIVQAPLNVPSAGQANFLTCSITFSTLNDWRDFPVELCSVYVHEFGHLVLGPTYFAGSNPTDPAHSPDPASIMYANPTTEQAQAASRAIGCTLRYA